MGSQSAPIFSVFICGAHSVGKTTLKNDLKERLTNIHFEGEVARTLIRELGWKNLDFDWRSQPQAFLALQFLVLLRQADTDRKNVEKRRDYMIERSIDPIIYTALYQPESKDRILNCMEAQTLLARLRESLVFVVTPHQECLQNDQVRLDPVLEELQQFTDLMAQEFHRQGIQFTMIKELDRQERVEIVVEEIRRRRPSLVRNVNGMCTN